MQLLATIADQAFKLWNAQSVTQDESNSYLCDQSCKQKVILKSNIKFVIVKFRF